MASFKALLVLAVLCSSLSLALAAERRQTFFFTRHGSAMDRDMSAHASSSSSSSSSSSHGNLSIQDKWCQFCCSAYNSPAFICEMAAIKVPNEDGTDFTRFKKNFAPDKYRKLEDVDCAVIPVGAPNGWLSEWNKDPNAACVSGCVKNCSAARRAQTSH